MGLRKLSLPLFRPRSSFVPIGQHRGIKPVRWRRRGAKIRVEGSKTWLYPWFLNLRVIFHDVTKPPTTLFFMCSIMLHFYGHGGGEKVSRPKSIPFFNSQFCGSGSCFCGSGWYKNLCCGSGSCCCGSGSYLINIFICMNILSLKCSEWEIIQ